MKKNVQIADDFQNMVKVDFQADADLGVVTLAELKTITGIIDAVESKAEDISAVNPKADDSVLRIEIPRAVVDPYFANFRIVLERRTHGNEAGDWTVIEEHARE